MKRSRIFTLGLLVIALLLMPELALAGSPRATSPAGAASSSGTPLAAPGPASWTFALYVNADNDLEYTWPRFTLPALKALRASDEVNVVAMIDWRSKKRGVQLVKVSGRSVDVVAEWPDKDFGSGRTLEWFLRQIAVRFPADHLAVGLWDHGYAWRYISRDDTSGQRISMPELRRALQDAAVPIDVLSFDACNMANVDVLYQVGLTGLVEYVVASEETIDQDGYPYDGALGPLVADPGRTPEQLAADMVTAWQRYYRPLRCFSWVSLSALDVDGVMQTRAGLRAWVTRLRADLSQFRARYAAALRHSIYAWDSWHVDLADVAAHLAADPAITDETLKSLSAAVASDARGAVVALANGSYASAFQGMTLWWGTGHDWTRYGATYRAQVAFARQIGWHGFLRDFNAGHGPGPAAAPDPKLDRADYGLTDITFTDADRGWAAGYDNVTAQAIIARTTDGGRRWTVKSPSWWYAYTVSSLTFLDARRGWAVGSEGYDGSLILKTTDGGRSWAWQTGRTAQYLLGADALDASHVWIAGSRGTRLQSRDGGRRWSGVRGSSNTDLWSVDLADAEHGWLVGGDAATRTGVIRYTDDGGASWVTQARVPGAVIHKVQALDGQHAWAVGGDPVSGAGIILHTGDAGQTWETSYGGPAAPWLSDVFFVDAANGWVVGERGTLLRTTDAGVSWSSIDVPTTQDLTAACFTDASNGWVVGDGEAILHTQDGGLTWTTHELTIK